MSEIDEICARLQGWMDDGTLDARLQENGEISFDIPADSPTRVGDLVTFDFADDGERVRYFVVKVEDSLLSATPRKSVTARPETP